MIRKLIKITLMLFVALNVNAQIQIEQLDYQSLEDSIFQSIDKSIDSLNVQIGTTGTDINAPSIGTNRTITVILPTAASSTGRIITISNHSIAMTTSIAYRTAAGTTTTAIAVNAEISMMSDGTEWFLTNN